MPRVSLKKNAKSGELEKNNATLEEWDWGAGKKVAKSGTGELAKKKNRQEWGVGELANMNFVHFYGIVLR